MSCIMLLTRYGEKFIKNCDEYQQRLKEQNEVLKLLNVDIIRFTADIVEKRDEYSGSHVKRVESYTEALAGAVKWMCPKYNLTDADVKKISAASILHDVGKLYVPGSILLKEDRLTPEEFDVISTHTSIGEEVSQSLPERMDPEFRQYCREICLCHHERWDGKGYPNGLTGDDIPISAQIVTVADCYGALTTRRPYKDAYPTDVATRMIIEGECGSFSPELLECFKECADEFALIYRKL